MEGLHGHLFATVRVSVQQGQATISQPPLVESLLSGVVPVVGEVGQHHPTNLCSGLNRRKPLIQTKVLVSVGVAGVPSIMVAEDEVNLVAGKTFQNAGNPSHLIGAEDNITEDENLMVPADLA